MFFQFLAQQKTPDTTDYMILGYILAGLIYLFAFVTIWLRHRSLNKDEMLLKKLENQDK